MGIFNNFRDTKNDFYQAQRVVGVEESPLPVTLGGSGATNDAAGRFKVSNPYTIFESKLEEGKSTLSWTEELNGSATSVHDPDNSCVNMSVTTTGDFAIRQTRRYMNYGPGKGIFAEYTGVLAVASGIESRIGSVYGDTSAPFEVLDGLCFESIEGTVYASIYKLLGDTRRVAQASWNVDPMDGSGPSGITIDWSKGQIFSISYLHLGYGPVIFAITIGRVPHIVHQFDNANLSEEIYMQSGNKPIRYEIRSTGGAATMKHVCSTVQSEGGHHPVGVLGSIDLDGAAGSLSVNTTLQLFLAIRLQSTGLSASIIPEILTIISTSNANFRWVLTINPIIGGTPAWSDIGSALQQWLGSGGATEPVTVTGPFVSGYGSNNSDISTSDNPSVTSIGSAINGTADVLCLAVQTLAGTDTFNGGLTVRQLV